MTPKRGDMVVMMIMIIVKVIMIITKVLMMIIFVGWWQDRR